MALAVLLRAWGFHCGGRGLMDGGNQFLDTAEGAAAQPILGQVAEKALDHVQPRAASGGEAHVERGMAAEPALDLTYDALRHLNCELDDHFR